MKTIIQKQALCVILFLLTYPLYTYTLSPANFIKEEYSLVQKIDYRVLTSPQRDILIAGYCSSIPVDICFLIRCLIYDNPFKYKNKMLPNDLSRQDLSGFDFTGCKFTHTDLTDADLSHVNLNQTICDYRKAFQDHLKENQCSEEGGWYKKKFPKDLKSIAETYGQLNNPIYKAKLLHIACGIARLPFYRGTEFYIKSQYWSCVLLHLKEKIGKVSSNHLVCSLEWHLKYDVKIHCWKIKNLQDKIDQDFKRAHDNFDQYLKKFHHGLIQYKCASEFKWGFDWYKRNIEISIEGLQSCYPCLKLPTLQEEACAIAYGLSQGYKLEGVDFLCHYLYYQNRLVQLKERAENGAGIHYNYSCLSLWNQSGFGSW